MNMCKLTVLYNEPFWVGIFEVEEGECYKASKVTFGAEPKDAEVYAFLLKNYYKLKFINIESEEDEEKLKKKENPKRLQRKIHKEVQDQGIGTKAQRALKQQHEENKIERKKRTKEQKEAEEKRLYEIKKQKKKEKHKGH